MKKFTLALSFLLFATAASAGPYVSLKGGVSHLETHELHFEEHSYDKGFGLAGSVGYDLGWFRGELEVLHTRNERASIYNLDQTFKGQGSGTVQRTFYFINGIFDVPIYEKLEGYVGGGYGFPRWQILGGLKYNFTKHWTLDTGYRFVHEPYKARAYTTHEVLGDICGHFPGGICSGPEEVYENHIFTIGVTYNF